MRWFTKDKWGSASYSQAYPFCPDSCRGDCAEWGQSEAVNDNDLYRLSIVYQAASPMRGASAACQHERNAAKNRRRGAHEAHRHRLREQQRSAKRGDGRHR